MPDERLRIAVIIGSTRQGRFAPTVADWFMSEAGQRAELDFDLIDLADSQLPAHLASSAPPGSAEALREFTERLDAADGFVIVVPEYNHSYPAVLKSAIDWSYTQWQAKPVGFVSYGGRAGGIRAVEHLRQVFCEMHATTLRDNISFHGGASQFGPDGRPLDAQDASAAAAVMLDQLTWWALALAEARARRPYKA
ncbi:NAD(P)H-dependent oxidoreductase [Kineosporia sp. J2-2]|uniref:NAD(P)H-dependent oxidoreductase n=1 Tax=Kineosporia corallincola TaxID=2835133 RepID=A0ABS5TRK9_9ACTN|nr:NAD(P)H-dependent oxidoreductase [Kineosporia corallincola]MBT0773431.1 NAD(P)H-dependent oxidoreductase [Kineosporia corallincola]